MFASKCFMFDICLWLRGCPVYTASSMQHYYGSSIVTAL